MAATYETLAQKLFPIRWWLLAAFIVLPFAYALGVRFLLTMPGLISPEADWFLLKLSAFFVAWPWGLFLVAVLFHPVRGFLRGRGHKPGLVLSAVRGLALASLVLLFLSPFIPLVLVP